MKLDVSKNIKLYSLNCWSSKLTELDVSKNTELTYLNCYNNNLTELDVSKNIELIRLYCYNNNLTELDVSKNTELTSLYCFYNNLTELDVSKNIELTRLDCNENNLTKLDVSKNIKLTDLNCNYNLFKFSTLPTVTFHYSYYSYSPQDTISGGEIEYTDTVDLSSEYNINGNITKFEWFDITNGTEKAIEQPKNESGVFTFTETHIEKTLRCKMRNVQFPSLTLVYEVKIKDTTDNIADENEIDFVISPNPANTQLTICHSKEISSILLYDATGKLLKTYTVKEINPTLDISDLSNGVYFITVDGKSVKFIKE